MGLLAFWACSGEVLPVAQNGPEMDGGGDAQESRDWCNALGGHCEAPLGSGACPNQVMKWNEQQTCGGQANAACCVPPDSPDWCSALGGHCETASSGACPNQVAKSNDKQTCGGKSPAVCCVPPDTGDGGSVPCGDAGGNPCLCGQPTCVGGKWTCTTCPADGGASGCNPACTSGEVCLRAQTIGGAIFYVDEAGACPPMRHPEGNLCVQNPTFSCAPIPSGCGGTPTCACASPLCAAPCNCTDASAAEIDCVCFAP
jgi:hypothetical protein